MSWWVCLVLHFASFMSYCKSLQTRPFALRWLRTSTCPFFTQSTACSVASWAMATTTQTPSCALTALFHQHLDFLTSEKWKGMRTTSGSWPWSSLWMSLICVIVKSKGSDDVCYLYCSSSDRESLVLRHCWVICEFRIVGTHVSATTCTWGIQMERTTRLEGHHFTPKVCNRSTDSRLQILTWVT